MKSGLKHSLITIMVFILAACTSNKHKEETPTEPDTLANIKLSIEDTAVYHIEKYKDFSPYFSRNGNSVDSTIYSASYPVFGSDIDTLIKSAIFVDGESTAEQVATSFLEGFNEYAEETMNSGLTPLHTWFMDQRCEVMLNVPRFITLRNKLSSYSGGAHGIELNLWFNYDIVDRRLLTISDIVNDTNRLKTIAEHYFKEHENLSQNQPYNEEYFFEEGQFVLADNFGFTKEGIVFHYNPYEIKSYAQGSTTIVIPYEELKNILTSTGTNLLKNIAQK